MSHGQVFQRCGCPELRGCSKGVGVPNFGVPNYAPNYANYASKVVGVPNYAV